MGQFRMDDNQTSEKESKKAVKKPFKTTSAPQQPSEDHNVANSAPKTKMSAPTKLAETTSASPKKAALVGASENIPDPNIHQVRHRTPNGKFIKAIGVEGTWYNARDKKVIDCQEKDCSFCDRTDDPVTPKADRKTASEHDITPKTTKPVCDLIEEATEQLRWGYVQQTAVRVAQTSGAFGNVIYPPPHPSFDPSKQWMAEAARQRPVLDPSNGNLYAPVSSPTFSPSHYDENKVTQPYMDESKMDGKLWRQTKEQRKMAVDDLWRGMVQTSLGDGEDGEEAGEEADEESGEELEAAHDYNNPYYQVYYTKAPAPNTKVTSTGQTGHDWDTLSNTSRRQDVETSSAVDPSSLYYLPAGAKAYARSPKIGNAEAQQAGQGRGNMGGMYQSRGGVWRSVRSNGEQRPPMELAAEASYRILAARARGMPRWLGGRGRGRGGGN